MRTLIVDDEYICRRVLQEMMKPYGETETVGSGEEAIEAFRLALDEKRPFDLVCLDIEMPGIDGHDTLTRLRAIEAQHGIAGRKAAKVFMTTVRNDPENVFASFRKQCEAYLIKPITSAILRQQLAAVRLVAPEDLPPA
jgi:two-component system chemotaxis response regulator CheY